MTLHFDAFLATLPIAAKGMAGIFLVTAVIILAVVLSGAVSSALSGRKDKGGK